jgi:hypothetical protein
MGKVVGGLIAATALLGLAGCGGGSSDDFVSEANEICKRANAKINGIAQPTSAAEIKGFLDKVEPVVEGALGQLEDNVTPPSDKKSAYNEWLATLRKQAVLIGQATAEADSGNTTQATVLVRRQAGLNRKGNRQAEALGLNQCSNVDSGSSG